MQTCTKSKWNLNSIWKPITGPVKDWPLALCHPRSLNATKQLEPCDLVYPDYVVENQQVYHSNELEWFYLRDQMPNEAWIFLQADTDPQGSPGEDAVRRRHRIQRDVNVS